MRALALLLLLVPALAEERPPLIDPNPPYVQVVVTACPAAETPLEPINQGKGYENERSMTRAERNAYFREIGCVEVPIPPEWITQELSYPQCRGPIGYVVSMQSRIRRSRGRPPWASGPAFPAARPSSGSPRNRFSAADAGSARRLAEGARIGAGELARRGEARGKRHVEHGQRRFAQKLARPLKP